MKHITFLTIMILAFSYANCVKWDDEHFHKTREKILAWWKKKTPPPVLQCSKENHVEAIARITKQVSEAEGHELLTELHTLILKADDKPFVGLNETLLAIRSRKAEVVIMSKHTHISVYDFRNPVTGNHRYEFCFGYNCILNSSSSDGSHYGTYYLVSCMPFPTFVKKYYPSTGPTIVSVGNTNDFFKQISGIGGFFENGFLLHEGKKSRSELVGLRRKFFLFSRN